jgi:GNAT superfamily N-acetyltransferase
MIEGKFGKNDVEVRPAREEDKAAVLAFCEQTWEHQEDYIYRVWDKWLADERGRIFVAVVDGLPVAMQRVVLMSDDEAWWEGLRVDPNYRGRGLVSVLRSPMEQYLLTQNIRVLRKNYQRRVLDL